MSNSISPTPGMTGLHMQEMMLLKHVKSKRASSWDRTGGNVDWLTFGAHETVTLAKVNGPGCIRHIYFTMNHGDRFFLRKSILRMYWDGEETPSVEVPLGDFFGLGFCEPRYFSSHVVTVAPGSKNCGPYGRLIGVNNYFPMPFRKNALITLENDSDAPFGACWYHIDYEEHHEPPANVAYFHAQWRRENPTVPLDPPNEHNLDGKENYVILEAEGWGNYVGMFLNVDNITGGWYGEGDDMIFIDDDTWPPSMHGTGSEEIFGGGACPNQEYSTPYTGYHLISNEDFSGKQSMYRFHVNDPVRFEKKIKVTIEHGTGNDLGNDYSSTAFWYQEEPHAPFPEMPDAAGRIPRAEEGLLNVYEKEMQIAAIQNAIYVRGGSTPEGFADIVKPDWDEISKFTQEMQKQIEAENYDSALGFAEKALVLYKRHEQK